MVTKEENSVDAKDYPRFRDLLILRKKTRELSKNAAAITIIARKNGKISNRNNMLCSCDLHHSHNYQLLISVQSLILQSYQQFVIVFVMYICNSE